MKSITYIGANSNNDCDDLIMNEENINKGKGKKKIEIEPDFQMTMILKCLKCLKC